MNASRLGRRRCVAKQLLQCGVARKFWPQQHTSAHASQPTQYCVCQHVPQHPLSGWSVAQAALVRPCTAAMRLLTQRLACICSAGTARPLFEPQLLVKAHLERSLQRRCACAAEACAYHFDRHGSQSEQDTVG